MLNLVSGKYRYQADEIFVVDDHTVTVKSEKPLYSLSVISKNSSARVDSVSALAADDEVYDLKIERNVRVAPPEPHDYFSGHLEMLDGYVSDISNDKQVIPAGEYFITFTEEIDISSLVLMYQPIPDL